MKDGERFRWEVRKSYVEIKRNSGLYTATIRYNKTHYECVSHCSKNLIFVCAIDGIYRILEYNGIKTAPRENKPAKTIAELVPGWPVKGTFGRNPADYEQGFDDGEDNMLTACEEALKPFFVEKGLAEDC